MTESYRALCSDFYVNQKLSVKLDLPSGRETTLDLFERVRKQFPGMSSFRRYRDELALEAASGEQPHRWLAVRSSNIRSGVVNPPGSGEAFDLHAAVLELAPFFLSISPLDIEYLEILYGFDLAAGGNQDKLVADALLGGSPFARLLEIDRAIPTDFEPLLGLIIREPATPPRAAPVGGGAALADADREPAPEDQIRGVEVHFEVKTRSVPGERHNPQTDPISVYVTLRSYEPVADLRALPAVLGRLREHGETLINDRVLPCVINPIREAISAEGA